METVNVTVTSTSRRHKLTKRAWGGVGWGEAPGGLGGGLGGDIFVESLGLGGPWVGGRVGSVTLFS